MKKLLTIIGAVVVLLLGAGGVYAVMNNNTNKTFDEAITQAEKHVKQHEWEDAKAAYNDAAKAKKTDMTTAANEQITAIQSAETIAGNDQQGAIDILDKSMKQKVTVPVIMTEMKAMKAELQKQLDKAKKDSENGSRSDLTPEAKPEPQPTPDPAPNADKIREQNIAEGNMSVADARARLTEGGVTNSHIPDSEIEQLIKAVKDTNGEKSLKDIAVEMHW